MIIHELHKLGIAAKGHFGKDQSLICPKCKERKEAQGKKAREKSLSVKIESADKAVYHCFSTKCGFKGAINLANRKKQYSRPDPWENSGEYPSWFKSQMEQRGISEKTLLKLDIRVKGRSIQFPYFRDGELLNIKTKIPAKDGKKNFRQHKDAEKILYNLDSLKDKEEAILVEGEMDVAALVEAGLDKEYGIVSIDQGAGVEGSELGGKLECLKNCIDEVNTIQTWILFLDNDAPGQYTQKEVMRRLGEHKCKKVRHSDECKDANDYISEGVLPIDRNAKLETLRHKIKTAESIPVPGIRDLDDEVRAAMIDAFIYGRKEADTTGFQEVDRVLRFMPGHLVLWTGVPNHGKGQMMRNMAVIQSLMFGIKWGVYAMEDYGHGDVRVDMYYEEIVEIYLGMKINPVKDLPKEERRSKIAEYEKAIDWVREHFICIEPPLRVKPTNEWVNEKLDYLRTKFGINGYIKDPWNKIFSTKEKYERTDEYLADVLSEEKLFASRNWERSWIVNHPNTLPKKKDGTLAPITIYSLNGGAMWGNMMDVVVIVSRPNIETDPYDVLSEIKTIKVKNQKLVARPGSANLYFNLNKRRFCEINTRYDPLDQFVKSDKMTPEDQQLNDAIELPDDPPF